jgi:RNA polymerase sigma factor (sigma-70 family)
MDEWSQLIAEIERELAQNSLEASQRAFLLIYRRLRRFTQSKLHDSPTVQATELVHEAYARLYRAGHGPETLDGMHFLRLCFTVLMNLLRDHARRRRAVRHGGEMTRVALLELEPGVSVEAEVNDTLLDFERIMGELRDETGKDEREAALDKRAADAASCRFLIGMELKEIADVMGLTMSQVRTAIDRAQALLDQRLGDAG